MSENPRPHSLDAERSALGAALQNEYASDEVAETLSVEDFYDRFHAEIFAAIADLKTAGTSVDLVTVTEALKRRGKLEAVGGVRYLAELVSAVPAPSNIRHYADIVREYSTRRKLIETAESIIEISSSNDEDKESVLEFAENEILKIGRSGQREDYSNIGAIVNSNIELMKERGNSGAGDMTGLTTGFPLLDRITLGLQPSDLIILAARPSQGKTSLALNIAANAAMKAQAVVLIFSLEMSKESLGLRMLSTQSEVEAKYIKNGQIINDSAKMTSIGLAAEKLAETRIFIDETPAISLGEMKNKCRRLQNKEGRLDLVIVDYLQLMDFGGSGKSSSRPENRQQEISTFTRMLKQLARNLKCPVLVLSQLSREVEKRGGHKPVLADLRESGAIEQDADLVMFIYQDSERPDGGGPDVNLTRQLFIAKHRNGETGVITLRWMQEYTKFIHYDESADWLVNVDGQ